MQHCWSLTLHITGEYCAYASNIQRVRSLNTDYPRILNQMQPCCQSEQAPEKHQAGKYALHQFTAKEQRIRLSFARVAVVVVITEAEHSAGHSQQCCHTDERDSEHLHGCREGKVSYEKRSLSLIHI